jgi:outer membrane protein TolC
MNQQRFYTLILCYSLVGLLPLKGQAYNLETCVQLALQNKKDLQAATLDVRSARAATKGSYSSILPRVSMSSGWSRSQFPPRDLGWDPVTQKPIEGDFTSITSWSGGLALSQTIYDGGIWWNTITQAKNNYEIVRQRERQVRLNVIWEVHRAFYTYLKAKQLLEVARLSLQSGEQQVELVKRQYELGAVKKTDLLKAEVRRGQYKVDVLNQEAAVANAYQDLLNAMGLVGTSTKFEIVNMERPLRPLPTLEEAQKVMEEKNPSLLAKREQVTAAEIEYKLTWGQRLPSLSGTMSYSSSAEDPTTLLREWRDNWQLRAGITLSVPLYSGHSLSTQVQQARLAVMKTQSEYITQLEDLTVQLQAILEALRNYRDIIPINEQVLTSAEEDLKLVQERYTLGAATILEVLDAQVSLISAQSSLIASKYDARIQEASLRKLLGTLERDFN